LAVKCRHTPAGCGTGLPHSLARPTPAASRIVNCASVEMVVGLAAAIPGTYMKKSATIGA
jgi:hypothetical protein